MMTDRARDLSDAALVLRCQGGDDDAWRTLVERYSRYVFAITNAYRLADADAEDVFQNVFARAYARLGMLRDPEALRPWLAQLTRRASADRVRARPREVVVESTPEVAEPDAALERLALAMTVRDALVTLPEPTQDVLDRFFTRDQSYEQIAADVGIPVGTVASRISRGLARLRQVLAAEGS